MEIINPKKLEKGDLIGIIAPSSGLGALFPHRIDAAIENLKKLGFKTKEFNCTRKRKDWNSGTIEDRVKDIEDAFLDTRVKAIICTIGGNTSNQLLPLLDFKIMNKNPKIFCGFSDITILHHAFFTKSKLRTFYGPCVMTQFGEYPKPIDYTVESFLKAVSSSKPIGRVIPSKMWTDELLDWGKSISKERARKLRKNSGFEWLKKGNAEGSIFGGCLPSILQLIGTNYSVNYKDKILFFELPEGQEFGTGWPLNFVDSNIMDLRLSGVFDKIRGLIVGRPYQYTEEDTKKLKELILMHAKDYNFPILFGADIGHSDPMITIPLGVKVKIDSVKDLFEVVENGVE